MDTFLIVYSYALLYLTMHWMHVHFLHSIFKHFFYYYDGILKWTILFLNQID